MDAPTLYHPDIVLKSPDFQVLGPRHQIDAEDNIGCFYNEKKEVHLAKRPKPTARPGEVVVAMRAVGICGSDVHFWQHGGVFPFLVTDETCGGHEGAGEIIELGEGVEGFKIGDRVAVECSVPCGKCELCLEGHYQACPDVVFFSTPPYHGILTRFHAHPAQWVHRLPDSISYEEGALLEPLVVALAGIDRSGLRLGQPLLICGAGPIGLVTLLAAAAAGASPIVITDISTSRLEFAQKICPRAVTVQIDTELDPKAQAAKIKEAAGMPLHVAIEATGVESSIITATHCLKFGSVLEVVGLAQPVWRNFPFAHCSAMEIDLRFLFRYANQYQKAIRLVAAGLIDLKPLVTHRFPMERAVEAFETAADYSKGSIKCQIIM